jgi:hypothetical protein
LCHLKRSSAVPPSQAPFERDVAVSDETRQLVDVLRIGAVAGVDGVDGRFGDCDFAEAGRDTLDLQWAAELTEWSMRATTIVPRAGTQRLLEDPEDDELRRLDGRHSDLANESSIQNVVPGHGGAIAGDEERFLSRWAEERTPASLRTQELPNRVGSCAPRADSRSVRTPPIACLRRWTARGR